MTSFTKDASGARVGDLGAVTSVEVRMEFEQKAAKGFLGRARNKLDPADPDLVAAACKGRDPVDVAEPKGRPSILGDAVRCLGDAKGAGWETIVVDTAKLGAEDQDITAVAFGAVCLGEQGFSRVAGAKFTIYNTSSGEPVPVTTERFPVDTNRSAVGIAVLKRTGDTWQLKINPVWGMAYRAEDITNSIRALLV